ncbi:hypothetical protein SASPL_104040 [Salvia splendens]|uniref:RWP-RK domain-containing protein n=1 Tax=Salvia splendens TaxID=180675 RepID=A0A8X9AAA0_SALSN|nr:hypothetical protein SASPL_104040 [Salvia splendens]
MDEEYEEREAHYVRRAMLSHCIALAHQSNSNNLCYVIQFFLRPKYTRDDDSLHLLLRILEINLKSVSVMFVSGKQLVEEYARRDAIECDSIDSLSLMMMSSKQNVLELDMTTYLKTVDSCCLKPYSMGADKGWVFRFPARQSVCEKHVKSNSSLIKEKMEKDTGSQKLVSVLDFLGFSYPGLRSFGKQLKAATLGSPHVDFHPRFLANEPVNLFLYQGPTIYKYVGSFLSLLLLAILEHQLRSFKMACGKQIGEELVVEVIEFSDANKLDSEPPSGYPVIFKSVQYNQKESHHIEVQQQNEERRKNSLNLTAEVLESHFGKKLKDVAKELCVGRSTIKRTCREHGIRRWPNRKEHKNNPSIFEEESAANSEHDMLQSTDNLHPLDIVTQINTGSADKVIVKCVLHTDFNLYHSSLLSLEIPDGHHQEKSALLGLVEDALYRELQRHAAETDRYIELQCVMDHEGVLSIIRGGEESLDSYSSITDFKQNLDEEALAHEKLESGWVDGIPIIKDYHIGIYSMPTNIVSNVYVVDDELQLGGVGRVYQNKLPESTPDLRLYSTNEFPMRDEAARCGFKAYMALPVFDSHTYQYYGVLELFQGYSFYHVWYRLLSLLDGALQMAGLRSSHDSIAITDLTKEMLNMTTYLRTVDSCCLKPSCARMDKGWVFSLPAKQSICANHVKSNSVLIKEKIEGFMKEITFISWKCNKWIVQFWSPKMMKSRFEHHPEFSPDLIYYTREEFSIRNFAMLCCNRGYMALPVFDDEGLGDHKLVGVLEFLGFYYSDLPIIRNLMEATKLCSSHIDFHPRFLATKPANIVSCRESTLREIRNVLSIINKNLPQVHTMNLWVPNGECVKGPAYLYPIILKSVQYNQKEYYHTEEEQHTEECSSEQYREECTAAASDFGKKLKDVAKELGNMAFEGGQTGMNTKKCIPFEEESAVDSEQDMLPSTGNVHPLENVTQINKRLAKLIEEVTTSLNLEMGNFKLKYMDEDGDEILLTRDADLQLCPKTRTTTGEALIQLLVR